MLTATEFREFLTEHWITTDNTSEKSYHHDQIHHILKSSYKNIGGYAGHEHNSDAEHKAISNDINNPNHIIKLNKKNDIVSAVAIYRKQHGRKRIAIGTDGSPEGKHHINNLIRDDNKFKRSWSEASGATEHLNKKHGTPEISNTEAERLTSKKIDKLNPDNSYDRKIGTEVRTKRLMGHTGNDWKSK